MFYMNINSDNDIHSNPKKVIQCWGKEFLLGVVRPDNDIHSDPKRVIQC